LPDLSEQAALCLGEIVLTSTERLVETNGVQLRVIEAGDRGAPVVVLAHGFPELACSWRHQIPALADLERAVLVGHDFGGVVAWTAPLLHPDRFAGIAGLSVPPVPRSRVPTTQAFRKVFGENFFYILYFQDPGPADAELNRDAATTLRRLMGSLGSGDEAAALRMLAPGPEGFIDRIPEPGCLPDWISQDEFDHYVAEFTRSGFTAPLNWYRCFDRNWELTATTPAATISVPSLFIGGAADPTLAYTPRHCVREVVSGDYREVMIDGGGHWIQQERPGEVNETLLDFLSRLEIR
jgi:pimeloyl-ACP methyl ester carboxylesterase